MPPEFDAGRFTAQVKTGTSTENYASLSKLKRGELYKFCKHHQLEITATTKKADLFIIALYFLVDSEFIDESVLDAEEKLSPEAQVEDPRIALAKAEAEKSKAKALEEEAAAKRATAEAEKSKADSERVKAEAEAALKLAQAERLRQGQAVGPSLVAFDPTRHVRMVPAFQEKDVESFFQAFEQNANTLSWPSEHWVLLLSTVLKGKAQIAEYAICALHCPQRQGTNCIFCSTHS